MDLVTIELNLVAPSLKVRVFGDVTSLSKQGLVEGNGCRNASHVLLLFDFVNQAMLLVNGIGKRIGGRELLILGAGSFGAKYLRDERALRNLNLSRVGLRVAAPDVVICIVLDQKHAIRRCSADIDCLMPVIDSID